MNRFASQQQLEVKGNEVGKSEIMIKKSNLLHILIPFSYCSDTDSDRE